MRLLLEADRKYQLTQRERIALALLAQSEGLAGRRTAESAHIDRERSRRRHMTQGLSPATVTLLDKAAYDNGFDVVLPLQGGWLGFASTRSPLRVWLGGAGDAGLAAALSRKNIGQALAERGPSFGGPLPEGAPLARVVADHPALHHNGLLLAPQLDAAFDRGLITVADDGTVAVSGLLGPDERRLLGLDGLLRARGLEDAHRSYLAWHRERVFRPEGGSPP